ncbi:MAG: diacylglycerol kinase family protein [Bacteroidetes bacterium]|nr:diacylglycerol kinase family protein [Bacteroidota bacterium]
MAYLKNRIRSFGYAFSGLMNAIKTEKNLQLQTVVAILVIAAGIFFDISIRKWLAVIGCITLVISLELINSAIEKLCDLYSKEQDPRIKYIKDVSAAAVLVASILSAIIGIVIFGFDILNLFGHH